MWQTFDEVVNILKSLKKIKNVRIEIKSEFWGVEYAAGADEAVCVGRIDRWADSTKGALYVMWTGYNRCQLAPLEQMDVDSEGESLGLRLLPFADGSPPPEEEAATNGGGGGSSGAAQQQPAGQAPGGADPPVHVDAHGQEWTKRAPKFVSVDARTQSRQMPSLNSAGAELNNMASIFLHLLPDEWIDHMLTYTNPCLDDSNAVNSKLTKGELLRFFGYTCCPSAFTTARRWTVCGPNRLAPIPPRRRR